MVIQHSPQPYTPVYSDPPFPFLVTCHAATSKWVSVSNCLRPLDCKIPNQTNRSSKDADIASQCL